MLRNTVDFERFAGQLVDITLKAPIGAAAQGQVHANRKKFRGTLERVDAEHWQIVWSDEPPVKPGQRVSKNASLHHCRHWVLCLMNCKRRVWRPSSVLKGVQPRASKPTASTLSQKSKSAHRQTLCTL